MTKTVYDIDFENMHPKDACTFILNNLTRADVEAYPERFEVLVENFNINVADKINSDDGTYKPPITGDDEKLAAHTILTLTVLCQGNSTALRKLYATYAYEFEVLSLYDPAIYNIAPDKMGFVWSGQLLTQILGGQHDAYWTYFNFNHVITNLADKAVHGLFRKQYSAMERFLEQLHAECSLHVYRGGLITEAAKCSLYYIKYLEIQEAEAFNIFRNASDLISMTHAAVIEPDKLKRLNHYFDTTNALSYIPSYDEFRHVYFNKTLDTDIHMPGITY